MDGEGDVIGTYLSVRCLHWWAGRELLDVAANVSEGEGKKSILLVAVGRLCCVFFQMIVNFPCFLTIFSLWPFLVFRGASLLVVPGKEVPHQIFQMGKQERQVQ